MAPACAAKLATEVDYRAAFLTHCQQVTPEGGLYWYDLRPTRQQYKFDNPDSVLDFAKANGMAMRGHTLVWYGAMPDWTKEIRSAGEAERELTTHIERVVSRYRGKIKTWHVVNEPIDDTKGAVPGLRPNIWLQQLGEKYIDLAFRTAHRVDPTAELLLNEYDIEAVDGTSPKRRQAFMKLIGDLLARGVPIHGIGLQGHLNGKFQIDRDGLYDFVSELRSLGLTVHVTELDVIDDSLPASVSVRDAIVAARAHRFSRADIRRRAAFGGCHLGHHGPVYLGTHVVQAQGRPSQSALAVRRELPAQAVMERDRLFLSAEGVK